VSDEQSGGIRYLDPRKLKAEVDAFGRLRVTLEGGEVHERVQVACAFPTSRPGQYVVFQTSEGQQIGLVADPGGLSPSSRRALEEMLALVYCVPIIQRIVTVKSQHGATTWEVETDRGPVTVFVKDRSEIRRLPGSRVLFTDVHGMRYEIEDERALDDRSRGLLDNEI
jgi:hypothetical protein